MNGIGFGLKNHLDLAIGDWYMTPAVTNFAAVANLKVSLKNSGGVMSEEAKCPECGGFRGLPRMLYDNETPRECSDPFHKETPNVIEFPQIAEETAGTSDSEAPQVILDPICPYCGADPVHLRGRQTHLGPVIFMVVRCANDNCRKTLGLIPLGMMQAPGMVQ